MVATIIMDENKNLRRTTTPTIYVNENNADEILILIPEYYNNLNIRECTVVLNWIQPSSENTEQILGNLKILSFDDELYKNSYLKATTPITSTVTAVTGDIELFLEITNASNEIIMKTGSAFIEIKDHKAIMDYIPEATIDILSDYIIKMQQINNTCNQTLALATEQAEKARGYATTILELLTQWETENK